MLLNLKIIHFKLLQYFNIYSKYFYLMSVSKAWYSFKVQTGEPKTADLHALAYISNLVSVQINHYQYLFLLRMAEDLSELATFLALDSNRILKQDNNKSLAIGALIPQLELTFVMPSQCPGKESSGGDLESVLPDSSSIADDMLAASKDYFIFIIVQLLNLSLKSIDNKWYTDIGYTYVHIIYLTTFLYSLFFHKINVTVFSYYNI